MEEQTGRMIPSEAENLLRQANLLRIKRDYGRAAELCRQALALEDTAPGHLLLGEILENSGDTARAMQEYRLSLDMDAGGARAEEKIGRLALQSAVISMSAADSGRNPLTAALLSAVFPGVGQLYSWQMVKGLGLMTLHMVLFSKLLLLSLATLAALRRSGIFNLPTAWPPLFILLLAVWIFAIVDAYRSAFYADVDE